MKEINDGQLVIETRAGHREAFSLLVARHQARLFQLCYRLLGQAADADELAHDAFVDAYLHLERLREPQKFGAWVRTIALNLCRMRLREGRHERLDEAEQIPVPAQEVAGRRRELLMHGLWSLSLAHRLVLVLHYWEGLSYEEVAQFAGVPVGTVMSRLHRAKRELRKTMETMKEEIDVPELADEEFRRVVEAEIAAILATSDDKRDTQNRLSAILQRTPERFARLVAASNDERERDSLALLIRYVGARALRAIFAAQAANSIVEAGTRDVLMRYVKATRNDYVSMTQTASRDAYTLVDELLQSPLDAADKASLLLDWMETSTAERDVLLYTVVLMRDSNVAFPLLMSRFRAGHGCKPDAVLYALCRAGTRFGAELIRILKAAEDDGELSLVLAGVEGLARSLNQSWLDMGTVSDEVIARELRFRLKWPPPLRKDRDPEIIEEMLQAVVPLLKEGMPSIVISALRILGCFHESRFTNAILECTAHSALDVRVVAIRALEGAPRELVIPRLLEILETATNEEKSAAAQVLGRLQEGSAGPILRQMVADRDQIVARAAVSALGEIGGEENRAILSSVVRAGGPLRAHAAKALGSGRVDIPRPRTSPTADRVRGDSEPYTNIALDAAVRELPAIREYQEQELTCLIARACYDFSSTRRYLIEFGLMTRQEGRYRFTDLGEAVWRVERYVLEYLS
jgi:RNA polymerase sigma-70 factor (ECF subfamily)